MMPSSSAAPSRATPHVSTAALQRARGASGPSDTLAIARQELAELEQALAESDARDLARLRAGENFDPERFLTAEEHQAHDRGAAAFSARIALRRGKLNEARARLTALEESEARVLVAAGRQVQEQIAREEAARAEAERLAREEAARVERQRLEDAHAAAVGELAGFDEQSERIVEEMANAVLGAECAHAALVDLVDKYQRKAAVANDAARAIGIRSPAYDLNIHAFNVQRRVHVKIGKLLDELLPTIEPGATRPCFDPGGGFSFATVNYLGIERAT